MDSDTEHLGLALALSVPVFIVVTKVDMCPPNVLQVRTLPLRLGAATDKGRKVHAAAPALTGSASRHGV